MTFKNGFRRALVTSAQVKARGSKLQRQAPLPPMNVSRPDPNTTLIKTADSPVTISVRHTSSGTLKAYELQKQPQAQQPKGGSSGAADAIPDRRRPDHGGRLDRRHRGRRDDCGAQAPGLVVGFEAAERIIVLKLRGPISIQAKCASTGR